MNTILKNVSFDLEIRAFLAPKLPGNPLPILHAMADSYRIQGAGWIHSEQAKAMMHTLNKMVYGQSYHLDGMKEQARLIQCFGK